MTSIVKFNFRLFSLNFNAKNGRLNWR